jgi:hypothetical protein
VGDDCRTSPEVKARPPVSDQQLDALRAEAEVARIGRLWLDEIRQACVATSRGFDPAVYGVAEPTWSTGEVDELVQDVTVEQLLRQGQLDYILDVAEGITDVRRLLRHQVRRALVRRRKRTVVDRLITRLSSLLTAEYEEIPGIRPIRYRPSGRDLAPDEPTSGQLRRASAAVRLLPMSPATGDRAPTVFRTEVLRRVAALSFEHAGTSLSLADFGRILSDALTSVTIIDGLEAAHRLVLRTKLSGASDSELASVLGVSRPTAAKRKAESFAALRRSWHEHTSHDTSADQLQLAQLLYLRLLEDAADE